MCVYSGPEGILSHGKPRLVVGDQHLFSFESRGRDQIRILYARFQEKGVGTHNAVCQLANSRLARCACCHDRFFRGLLFRRGNGCREEAAAATAAAAPETPATEEAQA